MGTYTGVVQKGRGLGAALGYPTANIVLPDSLSGIYAARVLVGDEKYFAAVFADPTRGVLEAHLLDFSGSLYDKEVEVTLEKKLRESAMFDDDDELRAAIAERR